MEESLSHPTPKKPLQAFVTRRIQAERQQEVKMNHSHYAQPVTQQPVAKGRRIATIAVLAAMIVVLQTVASGFHLGPFPITLSLIPIIIGAVLYGPAAGGILGAVFGLVVVSAVVTGADAGGFVMFGIHPIITVLVCIGKSTAAGIVSGLFAQKICPKNFNLGVMAAAIAAPVVNTAIFALVLYSCFYGILLEWAGGANALTFIFTGIIGVNFLIELLLDIILAPVVVNILKAIRKNTVREA